MKLIIDPERPNPRQIGQVVTNLLSNAADAVLEKVGALAQKERSAFQGHIHIRTETYQYDNSDGVLIRVSDNGQGVPVEIRSQVFDDFFTTKAAGKGTGLGLTISGTIIREHSGHLEISDDATLGGACFQVWLPLNPKNACIDNPAPD